MTTHTEADTERFWSLLDEMPSDAPTTREHAMLLELAQASDRAVQAQNRRRTCRLVLRVTPDELTQLRGRALRAGKSSAQVVREGLGW